MLLVYLLSGDDDLCILHDVIHDFLFKCWCRWWDDVVVALWTWLYMFIAGWSQGWRWLHGGGDGGFEEVTMVVVGASGGGEVAEMFGWCQ